MLVNRLSTERSPYLLQHAGNPVDWYPWGEEAFARAREEQKPIFLSIGYSTCHWCHVMEHESFEDPSIAALLNRDFIAVKVDREERPDIDRVYMTFVQAATGAGGWPMSVFLTPDLQPFFGGTYFPPTSRWGRPGFTEVLAQLASLWKKTPEKVRANAAGIVEQLKGATSSDTPDRAPVAGVSAITEGVEQYSQAYDRRHGGFGGAPKFPRPSELGFLLDAWALTGRHEARQMVVDTLRVMALGGMHDHLGGGFHRYSVDAEWRVPHFEKMLYDQAQLVLAYLGAAQASGEPFYATVAEDTLDYVLHELCARDGAFLSAEDADSVIPGGTEKREGAFYVFTAAEIDALFGADAPIVRRRLGIEDDGNAPSDPHGEFTGQNIPYVAQSVDEIATRTGRSPQDVVQVLAVMRQRMFEARATRPKPHLDDKVLTAWNGMMIAAFARAGRVLVDSPRRDEWTRAAVRAAESVRHLLWREGSGRLLRRYRDGEAAVDAFCEDYACLTWGLLELFQTTGDARWLEWAITLTARQTELFWDDSDGGWFTTTGLDRTVLLRLKEDYDGAEPSAASVTVRNLLQLAHLTGEGHYADRAQRSLERFGPGLGRVARVMPFMLSNVAAWHGRSSQIVIVGPAGADRQALEAEVARVYLPCAVQITVTPEEAQAALAARLPWLAAMSMVSGRSTAYVCQDFTCQAPVTEPAELRRLVAEISAPKLVL
ncbi:MAG: thioredoxin domain-containing protein [Acidimicrobiia bacterium]|nr:thioredoxin domain-containing protein [Acidimicrobiia bacterium]